MTQLARMMIWEKKRMISEKYYCSHRNKWKDKYFLKGGSSSYWDNGFGLETDNEIQPALGRFPKGEVIGENWEGWQSFNRLVSNECFIREQLL